MTNWKITMLWMKKNLSFLWSLAIAMLVITRGYRHGIYPSYTWFTNIPTWLIGTTWLTNLIYRYSVYMYLCIYLINQPHKQIVFLGYCSIGTWQVPSKNADLQPPRHHVSHRHRPRKLRQKSKASKRDSLWDLLSIQPLQMDTT